MKLPVFGESNISVIWVYAKISYQEIKQHPSTDATHVIGFYSTFGKVTKESRSLPDERSQRPDVKITHVNRRM